jgi:uncharacterized protein (PEP-CTERM system associated)
LKPVDTTDTGTVQIKHKTRFAEALTASLLLVCSLESEAQSTSLQTSPQISGESAANLEQRRKAGTLLPGVRTALSYSTNSSLENDGPLRKGGDFVLEVTPYVTGESEAVRFRYKVDYAIANLYRIREGDKIIGRQQLKGNLTAAIAGDWLWLDASGNIANVYSDLFGPLSADPGVAFVNSSQVRSFGISPYIRSRVFGLADGIFRYGLQWTDASQNLPQQSRFSHTFSANLTGTASDGQNWNWSWGGETSVRKYGSVDVYRYYSGGSVFWVPTPSLRVTGSGVYDQIDGVIARNGDTRGFGPGLGVEWNPVDKGSITAKVVRRYYGNSVNASANYSSRLFVASTSYSKGVVGSTDSSIFSIDPGSVFGTGSVSNDPLYRSFIAQNLRLGYGIPFAAGVIDDSFIQEEKFGASLGLIGVRNSITANLFRTQRDTTIFATIIPTGGFGPRSGGASVSNTLNGTLVFTNASIDYRYRFDARSDMNISLSHVRTFSKSLNLSSQSTTLSAGVSTKLTADTQAGAGIRRTEGKRTDLTQTKFDDTAVFGTVDVRF